MNHTYIIEKDYLDKLYIHEEEIIVEELNDTYSLYNKIIKIYSKYELELNKDELYSPLRILDNNQKISHDMIKMRCKYIEKMTNYNNITAEIEKKDDNYYLIFFTNSLPVYLKRELRTAVLLYINNFKADDHYYGQGKHVKHKLVKAGINFNSQADIHYGKNKLDKILKNKLKEKSVISDKELNNYLNLDTEEDYYHYNDLEDIKNILRVENNMLPKHKLFRRDGFLLLKLLNEDNLLKNIPQYNGALANNELLYADRKMLEKSSEKFYNQTMKHNKSIFDNQENAVCAFLNFKLNKQAAIMISEKDQWILYHQDDLPKEDENNCREKIIAILKEKGIDNNLAELNLTQLANLFIHNNELILSDENNIIYLDTQGKNIPLHMVINSGLHHHGYYDNGLWSGIIAAEKFPPVLPEIVDFSFSAIDNQYHVEVIVNYEYRKMVIDKNFYLPGDYYDIMNKQLKKVFSMGLMTDPFVAVRWQKEKELDIESISMPNWIKNVPADKEKELFNFLLQL